MNTLPRAALVALLVMLMTLGGCGFHLRGEIPGDKKEKTLFVTGLSHSSPFYATFTQSLQVAGGYLAPKAADARAVIQIQSARHLRRPIALSSVGRANLFDLTFRVVYSITSAKGDVLIPEQELDIRREYFNTQSSPLGQVSEESLMRTEMERDAAQTLLRRTIFSLREKQQNPP